MLLAGGALFGVVAVAVIGGWVLLTRGGDVSATQPVPTPVPTAPPRMPVAAPPSAEPASEVPSITGVVRVVSQPPGATVTVDGQVRGATPVDVGELPLGAHEVKVDLRGFAPTLQKVVLTAEAPQADLDLTLSRSVPTSAMAEVHSTPEGALVRIDGVAVGVTPLRQPVRLGGHTVEVIKDGFEPWSGNVDVQSRGTARVDAALRPLARATPKPEAVDTARVYQPGEVDTQPRRLAGGSAPYPDRAPRLKPGRDVTVGGTFVVSEEGEITEVRITESAGEVVDEAVTAAVRNWKYSPGAKRGVKVRVRVPFKQTFRAG
jgi:TonB family protein